MGDLWQDEEFNEGREMGRFLARWGIVFAAILGFVACVLWWASSALSYSASRVGDAGKPSYKITGKITDSRSGAPVPWAKIRDDPERRPPWFEASADFFGKFELLTLPEPHKIVVAAYGHKTKQVAIGKNWYLWMPSGEEEVEITLDPE